MFPQRRADDLSLQLCSNAFLTRSPMKSFEYGLDFRFYQAGTIFVISEKKHMSLKLIKLGLRMGRVKEHSLKSLGQKREKKKKLKMIKCKIRKIVRTHRWRQKSS